MLRSWQLPEPDSDAYIPASSLNVFSRAMPLKKSGVAPVWSGCFTPVIGAGVKWMMRERRLRQDALFYEFSLEDHVPKGHLLRSIDRFVELDGLRQKLAPFYSAIGRPSMIYCLVPSGLHDAGCFVLESPRQALRPQIEWQVHQPAMPVRGNDAEFLFHDQASRAKAAAARSRRYLPKMLGLACPVVPFGSAEPSHIWDNPEIIA
jgi:hypothetical protein